MSAHARPVVGAPTAVAHALAHHAHAAHTGPLAASPGTAGSSPSPGALSGHLDAALLTGVWPAAPPRRPVRSPAGRAPARGAWRGLPLPVLAVGAPLVAALGRALPALGRTLPAFLLVDVPVGPAQRRRAA
ncbi:hypothetical protein M2169_001456 [Streptomyces sp. MJP52]|nr:hypothetical protein [Streptomyces sp. MJP52]